jgi:succinate dehydrogenase/fumarate reductase cytochrome b subunit
MALTDIASATLGRIVGRLMRRLAGWALVGLFALAALYQASVAAVVALEAEFGTFYAHLMIAGFYALVAIALVILLWVTVRRPLLDDDYRKTLAKLPAEAQVATIVEALLLGYAMSRRK